jgi:hypothetical protein
VSQSLARGMSPENSQSKLGLASPQFTPHNSFFYLIFYKTIARSYCYFIFKVNWNSCRKIVCRKATVEIEDPALTPPRLPTWPFIVATPSAWKHPILDGGILKSRLFSQVHFTLYCGASNRILSQAVQLGKNTFVFYCIPRLPAGKTQSMELS